MKTLTDLSFNVQLIEETKNNESFAAISFNPNITWAKFILTDDKPNGNKHRIPQEEFASVIKTGTFMPIKMGKEGINPEHNDNTTIGVITHLENKEDRVEGLAALWSKEYSKAVDVVKKRYSEKKPIEVSWEITYEDSVQEDDGVTAFRGISMNAAAIVGIPAYKGRTPITAVASKTDLEDTPMEQISKEDHDKIVSELTEKVTELETKLTEINSEKASLSDKLVELETFKEGIEKETAKKEKLASLKTKFTEAGLELDEDYFIKNEDRLASMEDNTVEFFIQELVAFASKSKEEVASITITSKTVPNLTSTPKSLSLSDLAGELRKLDSPK